MSDQWHWRENRSGPNVLRAATPVIIVTAYAAGMTLLVGAPLKLFVVATHRCGVIDTSGFHLDSCAEPALVAIGGLTLLLSVLIGGMARVIFRHQHFAWPWLAFLTLATIYGVSATLDSLKSATDLMHTMNGVDSAKAGTFLGFWVLMVGYAAQTVWDEARDRVGGYMTGRVASWNRDKPQPLDDACPHCGGDRSAKPEPDPTKIGN